MEPLDGEFEPNDEVDELRWVQPADAADLLSYRTTTTLELAARIAGS